MPKCNAHLIACFSLSVQLEWPKSLGELPKLGFVENFSYLAWNLADVDAHAEKCSWSMHCCCTLLESGMRHIKNYSCTSKLLDSLMCTLLTQLWPEYLVCCMKEPLGDS